MSCRLIGCIVLKIKWRYDHVLIKSNGHANLLNDTKKLPLHRLFNQFSLEKPQLHRPLNHFSPEKPPMQRLKIQFCYAKAFDASSDKSFMPCENHQ
jgi:hypothetical protein